MKLFVPPLGTKIRLLSFWTFQLYNETRNMTLLKLLSDPRPEGSRYIWNTNQSPITVAPGTLPPGAILQIDRIYIRKGNKDFDSVSFTMPNVTAQLEYWKYEPVAVGPGIKPIPWSERKVEKGLKPPRQVRFWVKLEDANLIDCEIIS